MDYKEREVVKIKIRWFWKDNAKYLKKAVFKPYLEMLCLRLIRLYQKFLQAKQFCRYFAAILHNISNP